MGYEKYHFNETMTDAMLNTLEKSPTVDSIVSGTTHYHYQTPYYAGDWLVWHVPGTYSPGYYSYATTQHTRTEDDPKDSSFEDGDKTDYYYNFNAITGVNFLNHSGYSNVELYVGDNTAATNLTFGYGDVTAGMNATLSNLNFTKGGIVQLGVVWDDEEEVVVSSTGIGNVVSSTTVYYATTDASLTNLSAAGDFDRVVALNGGRSYINGVNIKRNMRELAVAPAGGSYGVGNKNLTGSGTLVDSVTVSGRLNSVYVGSGASLNMLTVGLQRSFTSADLSAFGYFSSSYFGSGGSWVLSSATYMNIESGGTASNIYLNNGGQVTVFGPEDRVSSTWNSTTQQYDVTTSYASGAGGTLTNLQMSMSGGLQFGGLDDSETWQESNGVYWSADYRSHHRAAAPQSAYVEFQSNTFGSNISIGQGGSMRISAGASVTNISMGALVTSTFHTSGGKQIMWVGDRGAKLVIDGGFASNVVVEGAHLTSDYYFAVNNDFSTLSSSIQSAYYESHGSYMDNNAASALAAAGYNAFMSSRYQSAYQSNYDQRYLGGEIIVGGGGTLLNASGFAYLYADENPDTTFSSGSAIMSTRIGEVVSKAEGALSATVEIDGAAHVTSITAAGGRFVMGGGSGGVTRWANQSNAQSNYAQAEYINLRTSGLEGDNHSAMVLFGGYNGSGQQAVPVMSNGSQVYGSWTYYDYECIDPGEIHYLTGDKGLIVKDLGWGGQDFTYTGSGAVTINGLGTVVLKDNHERRTSDSYYGKGPYLGSAYNEYYFGVVKGVYDEENGKLQQATILNGEGGFDWKGFLVVGSGGIVQDVGSASPLKTGNDIVNSDTWTPSYTYDECKVLTVVAGGSADNVTVKGAVRNFEHNESQYTESRAGLLVSSGGTATNVTVLEGGIAMAKGGTINGVFVGNSGVLYLSGWAGAHQVAVDSHGSQLAGPQYLDTTVLNAVRLDSGGQLTNTLDWGFRTGGHAPSVIANAGGGILNGVTANGVAYVSGLDYAGAITLTNGQQGLDLTVRGFNTITSRDAEGNPTAYTTTIASLNVSSGGIVKGATVGDEGAIYVSEGADVSGLSASGGRIIFENAGSGWGNYLPGSATVDGITVKDGGILQVNSKFGLTATNMKIEQDAGLEFTLGDTASEDYTPTALNGTWTASWGGGAFYTDDGTLSGFGGQFGQEYRDLFYSSSYVSARLSMTVAKGGILTGADLRGYGSVRVTSGGKIFNTKLKGVGASIQSGGYASGLSALTDPDRTANQTQIWAYGSGATLDDTVLNGGLLGLEIGAVANGVTMTAPEGYTGSPGDSEHYGPAELEIQPGGTANNVVASAGIITLGGGSKEPGTAGPTLNNADVHSAASIIVQTDDGVMAGTLNLGGKVVTTAKRYEYVEVEVTDPDTGNVYTDWQRVEKNNATANASTLTVNFDLTERNGSEEGAMIDNLANLQGATLGTITVNWDQAEGQYVLAQGAEAFTGTLAVICEEKKVGDFSVGTIWQYTNDTVFMLTNNANVGLAFTVQNTAAAVENIIATVGGQELLKGQWTNQAVTIKTSVNQYTKSIWYKIKRAAYSAASPLSDAEILPVSVADPDGDWLELDNENGLVISEYCDVDFMALDANGRQSQVVTYTVNYDAAAAVIGDFRSDATTALYTGAESQVSVTVTDDHDQAPALELQSGADWVGISKGENGRYAFTVSGNGEYTLRATDHAGNVSTQVVTVDFYTDMPTEPPTVVSATPSTTDPTNRNVTVTAVFSRNASSKQYSLDGVNWLDYTGPVTMEANGNVFFRAWNPLGYSDTTEVVVTNIDKVAPDAPVASADITAPTNQNVIVSATFSDDSTVREFSLDGQNWQEYTQPLGIIQNWTVYFRSADAAGNVSEVTEFTVDNIDRTAPAAPVAAADVTAPTPGVVIIVVNFSEDSVLREYSFDGQNWQAYTDGVTMQENGSVFFRGTDAAGNVSEVTEYAVTNIDREAPAVPAGFEVTVFEDKARIDWADSADTGSAGISGYEIGFGATEALGATGTLGESMAQLGNLTPGTWYYRVRAVDNAGNASDWSELRSFEIADNTGKELEVVTGGFSGGGSTEVLSRNAEGTVTMVDTTTGQSQEIGNLDRDKWEIMGSDDYNKDGTPDLLLQDRETGTVYIANDVSTGVSGDSVEQTGTVLGIVSDGYELAGVGNFNGSSFPGALLTAPEQVSGESKSVGLACWTLDENFNMTPGWLGSMVTTWDGDGFKIDPADMGADDATINAKYYSFELIGVGDFNGDGTDDIMIRNNMPQTAEGRTITGSGDVFVFLTGTDISGYQAVNVAYTGCAPDPWRIAGIGDFNGDGIDDVLLENTSDGMIASWLLDNTGHISAAAGIGTLGAGQRIAGIGDVDGDNVSDVLVADFDGSVFAWTVQDGAFKSQLAVK